ARRRAPRGNRQPPAAAGHAQIAGLRLFVAVLLPDDIRQRLAAAIDRLRPHAADVAWVAESNLHVTLKFLGQVDETRAPALADALARGADFARLRVERVSLMRSELSPRGARYSELAAAPLALQ